MTGYVIRGGKPGYDRLLLLARDRWPDTRALLERAGVSAAVRCIDIGCGGGEVTLEIARLVGPAGRSSASMWTRSKSVWLGGRQRSAIGRKLFNYFLQAGIPHPQVTLVQPAWCGCAWEG